MAVNNNALLLLAHPNSIGVDLVHDLLGLFIFIAVFDYQILLPRRHLRALQIVLWTHLCRKRWLIELDILAPRNHDQGFGVRTVIFLRDRVLTTLDSLQLLLEVECLLVNVALLVLRENNCFILAAKSILVER